MTPCGRVFNEVCVCVFEVLFEVHVFVLCLMYNDLFWKQECLIDVLLFSPLCCVRLDFRLLIIPPLSVSSSPATRRWRSGCQRCGGRGENRRDGGSFVSHFSTTWATDLWPARFYHRNVTLKSQFPRRSECLFLSFFVTRQHDKAEVKYVVKRKSLCLSDCFLLPIWKCHSNVVLLGKDKQHRAWLCVCIRQKGILSWHENYCNLVSNKWKSVLLFLQTVSWTCSETCVFMHLLFEN